jgi:DNA-directed RNA polymerase specialized sigma24 family protein
MTYKYDAFKMHYIDGASYEEIADIQNCGKNTPSRWSKELIRKMSVKLFGIDGVEKY